MLRIKRLHLFVLKSFLPIFAMTFFIVLFIVLMQFLWRYVDDLVGKGLELHVLAELFFYAAVTMVPMSLPLAILLASLMTFGNFGERLELTAMKASGISLVRVMMPLIILVSAIAVGAFFFQNEVLPRAQVKMYTLLFSVKQKKPDVEIPEGTFYTEIDGFNLYVKSKNKDTGVLRSVMIYDVRNGGVNATILVADSAVLSFTPDMSHLYLHMWRGEQFENLREQTGMERSIPFRREEFAEKEIMIPFDAKFTRLDDQTMRKQYVGKNITELRHTIDSVGRLVDSAGRTYARFLGGIPLGGVARDVDPSTGALRPYRPVASRLSASTFDSLVMAQDRPSAARLFSSARMKARNAAAEYEFKAANLEADRVSIRRHSIELMKKFTLSVACLIFFFIGAPLGAIIRKGGIGWPLVISVFLFIIYYIIDNTGYKMARDGRWPVWEGMWISTFVLTPLGIFATYKAMKDSSLFNPDAIRNAVARLLGRSHVRSISPHQIVLHEFDRPEALDRLASIRSLCAQFVSVTSRPMSYRAYFLGSGNDAPVLLDELIPLTDTAIDAMLHTRDQYVINKILDFPPIDSPKVLTAPRRRWLALSLAIFAPAGVALYVIYRRALKRTRHAVDVTDRTAAAIVDIIREGE